MRLRFFVSIGAFFLIVRMIFAIVLINPRLTFSNSTSKDQSTLDATAPGASNEIMRENAQLGTTKWEIPLDNQAYNQIQAYTSATSISPGEKITFYVSTQIEGTHLFLEIYRLGWYGGDGGRLMTSPIGLIGQAQGYYDTPTYKLVNCSSCYVNGSTGLVEANWKPSYSLIIPSDWTTGVYLAKFTDIKGKETYASFEVRGNPHSEYIVVTSDNTYQAYNDWGGYSLYEADNASQTSEDAPLPRGVEVSFDRPYTDGEGSGQVLTYEINTIRWLERQGYDLCYISSVDLHENPGQLLQHRAYLSIGHDEYWSKEMRDTAQVASTDADFYRIGQDN